jgi:hypothetical protein
LVLRKNKVGRGQFRQKGDFEMKRLIDTYLIVGLVLILVGLAHALNQPPVASCQDVIVDVGEECEAYVEAVDVDDGSYDPDGDEITIEISPEGPYPLGDTVVTLTVTDTSGASDFCEATVMVVDTTPPTIICPADVMVEQESPDGTGVALQFTAIDNCDSDLETISDALVIYPLGDTVVTFTAIDDSGNSSSCETTVTVVDTTAPEVACSTSPDVLWPRNNQMVSVDVFIAASDNDTQTSDLYLSAEVASSDPDDTKDGEEKFMGDVNGEDGYIGDPVDITGAFTPVSGGFIGSIELRAECAGNNDRAYMITTTVVDDSGNSTTSSCEVLVHANAKGKP